MEKNDEACKKRKFSSSGKCSMIGQNKLTLQRRLELIEKVEGGEKRSKVAAEFNVTKQYVTKLMKPHSVAAMRRNWDMKLNPDSLRTPVPVHEDLEIHLVNWVKTARSEFGLGVSGPMIQDRARRAAPKLNAKGFTASNGWLHRFVRRYSLSLIHSKGQTNNGDKTWAKEKIEGVRQEMSKVDLEHIFNMDETGLFYRSFPKFGYITKHEAPARGDPKTAPRNCKALEAEERVTIIACSNTTGSLKLPLAIVSTEENTKIFQRLRQPRIPHFMQRNAWLDSTLCQRWFDEIFVPFVKKLTARKVVLLWDTRWGLTLKNDDPQILIVSLPPKITPARKPMKLGILKTLKVQYKAEMLARLAVVLEDWEAVRARKVLKDCRSLDDGGQAHLLDATDILADKWAKLPERTIMRCWLDAKILSRQHEQSLKSMDKRLRGEQLPDRKSVVDGIIAAMLKMSMPAADAELSHESLPRVLVDNLCVERKGLEEVDVRKAVETWLGIEDDPEVLLDEIELELLRPGREPTNDDGARDEMTRNQTSTDEQPRDRETEDDGVGNESTSHPGIGDEGVMDGDRGNQGTPDADVRYEGRRGQVARDGGLRHEGHREGEAKDYGDEADGGRNPGTGSEYGGVKDQGTEREMRGFQEAEDQGTGDKGNRVQGMDEERKDPRAGDGDTIESGMEADGVRPRQTGGGGGRSAETRDVATADQGTWEVERQEKETRFEGTRYEGMRAEDTRTEKAGGQGMPGWEEEEDWKPDLAISLPTAVVVDRHRRLKGVRSLLSDDGNNGGFIERRLPQIRLRSLSDVPTGRPFEEPFDRGSCSLRLDGRYGYGHVVNDSPQGGRSETCRDSRPGVWPRGWRCGGILEHET